MKDYIELFSIISSTIGFNIFLPIKQLLVDLPYLHLMRPCVIQDWLKEIKSVIIENLKIKIRIVISQPIYNLKDKINFYQDY